MSKINQVLNDDSVRKIVWESFKIDEQIRMPPFVGDTLYGDLSTSVHSAFAEIYMSDDTNPDLKSFFYALSDVCTVPLSEYLSHKAAFGKRSHGRATAPHKGVL